MIGCAIHSQVDTVQMLPAISLILVLQVALLLVPDERPGARQAPRNWILPTGWAFLLGIAVWSLYSGSAYSHGVRAANGGHWDQAFSSFQSASRRDPAFAYYQLQAGYVGGVRAEGHPDQLSGAIHHYQAGIARSPNYALNSANLAALLWQAGDADQALAWMDRAVEQAPQSALFHLNLGRLYEEMGQEELAWGHYGSALDLAPDWADAYYWRATSVRAAARQYWGARQYWLASRADPEPVDVTTPYDDWYWTGQRALTENRHRDARHAFQQALSLNPRYPRAYIGQAAASAALGLTDEAEKLLRTAIFAGGGHPFDGLRARFALARLYRDQGRTRDAIELADDTISVARDPYSQIGGRLSHADYATYLFHSQATSDALLPQLASITVTDEVAEWMLQLGSWHEEVGDTTAAARVYEALLEEVPDCETARERLSKLSGASAD